MMHKIDEKIIELSRTFDTIHCEYKTASFNRQLELIKKYFPIGIIVEANRDF
jgi:hypothetical protein